MYVFMFVENVIWYSLEDEYHLMSNITADTLLDSCMKANLLLVKLGKIFCEHLIFDVLAAANDDLFKNGLAVSE